MNRRLMHYVYRALTLQLMFTKSNFSSTWSGPMGVMLLLPPFKAQWPSISSGGGSHQPKSFLFKKILTRGEEAGLVPWHTVGTQMFVG